MPKLKNVEKHELRDELNEYDFNYVLTNMENVIKNNNVELVS